MANKRGSREYTTKQMGTAGEQLVAAYLTLHGVPSFTVPVDWPGYDVVAAPKGKCLQRISVKCRGTSNIQFHPSVLDWLAIVLINQAPYRIFVIPRGIAVQRSKKYNKKGFRTLPVKKVPQIFKEYENKFELHG